jgi:hypothetical protein
MLTYFSDYADSYLAILKQLVRREIHLRQGLTPLTRPKEKTDDFRPLKVAVSPLSYGPITDKMLASALLRSMGNARFVSVVADPRIEKVMEGLNSAIKSVMTDIAKVAPKVDGFVDVGRYLHDVFWLDLGQLLYVLDRSFSVFDAFYPFRNVSFSTRDFWTEIAAADRSGLTRGRWRPVES